MRILPEYFHVTPFLMMVDNLTVELNRAASHSSCPIYSFVVIMFHAFMLER